MIPLETGHRDVITEMVKMYGPKSYLEVGVMQGKSVEAAVRYKSLNRLLLCDQDPHCQTYVNKILLEQQFLGEVEWLIGKSQTLLPTVGYKFDFVHIDGDHNEESEYQDLVNGWKLCKSVMIVHDISFSEVQTAVEKFLDGIDRTKVGVQRFTGDQETLVITR